MKHWVVLIFTVMVIVIWPKPAAAAETLAQRLSGYILLQVERHGMTWYVYPPTKQRYYLGNPTYAFGVMRDLSLGITDANLAKIPVAGSSEPGDLALRQRLAGYILLQVEQRGATWYVDPRTLQRYSLGNPTNAFAIMRNRSLGITNTNLEQIPVAPGFDAPTPTIVGLTYTQRVINSSRGSFTVDLMTFDRTTSSFHIKTDTGQNSDCRDGCATYSLLTYINRRSAISGIHGTYFCPREYSSCVGQTGSYLYPVYNSFTHVMINGTRIKYTTQPLVAFDTNNVPYYYHQAKDFKSQANFEATNSVTLQAAVSNGPALVEAGKNILDTGILDTKQATVKSFRGALGWKGTVIYLMVVHGATVTDSAAALTAMGLDYAINLDGGGSTAMYTQGRYIIGPGRDLPNAILITR